MQSEGVKNIDQVNFSELPDLPNILFCNSKSIEMFGFDLTGSENYSN